MARPLKKRRVQPAAGMPESHGASSLPSSKAGARIPRSMVIRIGASNVGPAVTQLVHDTRQIMEPHTASKLRERKTNRLRDYTTMAGPLGVSHLLLFSRSKDSGNVNLRLAATPRGPTLGFRVESYSLSKDIAQSQRRPKMSGVGGLEHVTPPLLVMNNFNSPDATADSRVPKHLEGLLTSTFQSLFPPIAPQSTPLSSIRRVLLLNREQSQANDGSYVLNLRHYAISTKVLRKDLSRGLKRLNRANKQLVAKAQVPTADNTTMKERKKSRGALPNLGRLDDVADYLLDPGAGGYTSASESEVETEAEVDVVDTSATKVMNRRDRLRQEALLKGDAGDGASETGTNGSRASTKKPLPLQKKAVKLTEIGPRMKLRLLKVEEGLCAGRVMWHEFVEKTRAEEQAMEAFWEQRKREKEERRQLQKANLEAKRKANGGKTNQGEGDEEDEAEDYDPDFDDDEWDEVADEDGLDEEEEEEGDEEMEEAA